MGLEFAEGAVTRLRRESKWVLEHGPALAVRERLSTELGEDAPEPTLITSVYFDAPGLPLTRRALHQPHDCLKVRTKEYFPDRGAWGAARVVLETKREHGGVTQKRRAWLPRERLRAAIQGGAGVLQLIADGRLQPVLAVTYHREVYQRSEDWRVTVDRGIAFYLVTAEVAFSPERLGPEQLGPPVGRDDRVVVEVKHLGGAPPPWLLQLGGSPGGLYSKFAEGMTRILTGRVNAAEG